MPEDHLAFFVNDLIDQLDLTAITTVYEDEDRGCAPAEWLVDVRAADEDGLLALAGHLPAEPAEAVLELATGGTPQVAKPEASAVVEPLAPFTHPDAQRLPCRR